MTARLQLIINLNLVHHSPTTNLQQPHESFVGWPPYICSNRIHQLNVCHMVHTVLCKKQHRPTRDWGWRLKGGGEGREGVRWGGVQDAAYLFLEKAQQAAECHCISEMSFSHPFHLHLAIT